MEFFDIGQVDDMDEQPKPETPEEAGIENETPDLAQIEPARLLADDARTRLQADGFTDRQIIDWAETYLVEEGGTADVDDFIAWIRDVEA